MKLLGISSITLDVESRNSVSLVKHFAADVGVPVSKMCEWIEVLIQAFGKTAILRILAASLGTKLPTRWAQGRSSSTTLFRKPISLSAEMNMEASYCYTATRGTCKASNLSINSLREVSRIQGRANRKRANSNVNSDTANRAHRH